MPFARSFPILALAVLLSGCVGPLASSRRSKPPSPGDSFQNGINIACLTDVDIYPVVRFVPAPAFDYQPRVPGLKAKVAVELGIDCEGVVTNSKVVSSYPASAGRPIALAFLHAKFRPAAKAGEPVECRVRITEFIGP